MESKKRLITVPFSYSKISELERFCEECKNLGYKNNQDLEAMRLSWTMGNGGKFFMTYLENDIVSISGCHPIPEVGKKIYRLLFRGASLPAGQNWSGLISKSHMNSIPFFFHIPEQIKWAQELNYSRFVITTNWENADIRSMDASHRVLTILSRQGIVNCLVPEIELFDKKQTVWELNLEKYFNARNRFSKKFINE
jgi:hypothetical protein